ncbi:plexin-C1 isoform X2 [Silurus meridionalis]|uniref:Plexin C1 n=1 Tax=Silurus meridionalis TaxID=175797 RepID=A0A8T0B5C6_SILME|nr:plexin-C1 isoform X2 [Silurus meridionalis]KAF7701812.1 hypothetical protein HF521_001095 [Silurus meridionalis]
MRAVLLGIFILVNGAVWSLDHYNFNGVIRHFVVENDALFIATDSQLHQLSRNLSLEKTKVISNTTHQNALTLLLPFSSNGTLIICGTADCGYCEILNISDITRTIYMENYLPVGPHVNESSVAFLINFDKDGTYLLVGREDVDHETECTVDAGVTLRYTIQKNKEDIFSKQDIKIATDATIKVDKGVKWVDGFQVSSKSQSYIVANNVSSKEVVFLKLDNQKNKADIIQSLLVSYLHCCGDQKRHRLVSSTIIESSFIWVGIFSAELPHHPENTALVVYNISEITEKGGGHGFNCIPTCDKEGPRVEVEPLAVVFKHNSMTSVAAEQKRSWTVLYIGTANSQIIKLVLDTEYKSGCAKVLYSSDDDRMVFRRMYFDPVDHNYIYMALGNQINRIAVTNCSMYNNLRDCIGSMDPFCGWCETTNKCSVQEKCPTSQWLSISPKVFFLKNPLFTPEVSSGVTGKINLTLHLHLNATGNFSLTCTFKTGNVDLCKISNTTAPVFNKCSCEFPENHLSSGPNITVTFGISNQTFTERVTLRNCPTITENMQSDAQCATCVSAGCYWNKRSRRCNWAQLSQPYATIKDICGSSSEKDYMPEILSLWPNEVSFHGKNNAVIKGKNLQLVEKIRFQGVINCNFKETPVLERFNDTLKFHIPSGNKETVRVCVVTADERCHSNATVTYSSQPICSKLQPNVSWSRGNRKIHLLGSNLEFVDAVRIHSLSKELILSSENKSFWFHTYNQNELKHAGPFSVFLVAGNSFMECHEKLSYSPDPEFTSFSTSKVVNDLLITIQKKEDDLDLSKADLEVWGVQEQKKLKCIIENIKSTAVICKILGDKNGQIQVDSLVIQYGNFKIELNVESNATTYIIVTLIILILLGAVAGVFIHRKSQQQMNAQMNEHLELLENEIRNEIRQGFVDLQTESSDLIENVAAIPYLDYKHFALRIFFPEGGPLANQMIKEIGQDAVKSEMDERFQAFSSLIQDQTFLVCFVHALESQKSFSIKDKCTVASLLTVALHSDLPYLTQLMEELLQNLIDQPSNAQLKLLLRRTESIVEKLLTNWMSICLYGFLRESVGQPLFLMASALNQQIAKGPVDAVTEKALYTLNEDWLLWQAQGFNFSPLKLKVLFAVGTEGEVSEPLEVSVLTCDTIDQVKDKILQTFQRKFGFRYTQQLRDIGIEYIKEGSCVPLEEVDGSSEVQGEVTMLNTLKHYKIPDGASIKVITKKVHAPLSPQISLKDDQNFTTKYFHLIDPDNDTDQSEHPERKKLKLKEIYLTKLLSTKVAVHSFVETLFQSIWGMPNNRAPLAVKYFFDFLDSQAEKKKIIDPDVLHIWKTNSLPLRFWVNILKNPNFVFSDLEKTSHLDSCLSVIAQAFMDSFSLTDHQLGKHAPTNKLLYAKDIPRYKQEVKTYYKLVRDQPSVSSQDFKVFLQEESKKHENEFNEPAALRELYKYMARYFSEIEQLLEQNSASCGLKEEMHRVKELFESVKRSAWI